MAAAILSLDEQQMHMNRRRLIGRDDEREAILRLLQRDDVPLLTLTGPGGVGKTRLAVDSVRAYQQQTGVEFRFVDLSAVRDPSHLPVSVAHALDVQESSAKSIESLLVAKLRGCDWILVLDNLEQVVEPAAGLIQLVLDECSQLTILATSRSRLRLSIEQNFPVEPLPVPPHDRQTTAKDAMVFPAVQLFVARSQAINPAFALRDANVADVVAICAEVEGLPLAVELAAARTSLLPLSAIRDRMTRRLPLPANGPRDAPERHRSLADTVGWSYDLLTGEERWLFRQLSVFRGGISLDAASAIAGGPIGEGEPLASLARLVDHSLIAKDEHAIGGARFRMLEPVREAAADMLEAAGERAQAEEHHAKYFLSFVEREQTFIIKFISNGWSLVFRLEDDYENVKLALEWFNQSADTDGLARLASALGDFWLLHGHYQDRRRWLAIADKATRDHVSHVRVAVLVILAVHYSWLGEHEHAIASSERALVMARELRHDLGIYHAAARSGIAAGRLGHFDLAQEYQFEALAAARRLHDEPWSANAISSVYGHLGNIELSKGDIDAAEHYFDQALEEQRRQGFETGTAHLVACHPIGGMGDVARARGELPLAFERYRRYLELAWKASDARAIGFGLGGVAGTLAAAGRWREAAWLFGAAEAFHESAGIPFDKETMDRQRALGLPEPWQRADEAFGKEDCLRLAVATLNPVSYVEIPDAETAAQLWSEGRRLSLPDVIEKISELEVVWPASSGFSAASVAGLTVRETEVLRMICTGKSDQEIGEALFITRRTAATHVSRVLQKLDVKSRAAAAVWAVRSGVIQ